MAIQTIEGGPTPMVGTDPVAGGSMDPGAGVGDAAVDAAGGVLGVGGDSGDLLPFTGAGPMTIVLMVLGIFSVIGGAIAALFAWLRRRRDDESQPKVMPSGAHDALPDLTHLADTVA